MAAPMEIRADEFLIHYSRKICQASSAYTPLLTSPSMCYRPLKICCKFIMVLTFQNKPSVLLMKRRPWWCYLSLRHLSAYQRHIKQVFFLDNSQKLLLNLQPPYKTVHDTKEFGVKALKGAFRRRPELIKQKTPDKQSLYGISGGVKSYGLFDKCERIQQELTEKALELMSLEPQMSSGLLLLDIGCGHGWSLTVPALKGFCITGIDLDAQALTVVQHKISSRYLPSERVHTVRTDAAHGLGFRENVFDFAISISFLQWLCVGKNSRETLDHFFHSLSSTLTPGGKAGIQFYPRSVSDVDKVVLQAKKYFKGALISDFPHVDRGRKLFLILLNDK